MKKIYPFYQIALVKKYVKEIFPLVDRELQNWNSIAEQCSDKILKEMAQKSIKYKSFHAKGGSIYALFPGVHKKGFVGFVVALQTISDYLDNLCDRAGVYDEAAFRQLHLAMLDALNLNQAEQRDYYQYYPYKSDGGYLISLKDRCQKAIKGFLPGYPIVKNDILQLANLYVDLQSQKHLKKAVREEKLLNWAEKRKCLEISPWEFSAATGSTLGIFILAAAATERGLTKEQVEDIKKVYFPWITGLHILLDYFIDLEEDEIEGDLNFVSYYEDLHQCRERLVLFFIKSKEKAEKLPYSAFHLTVLEGLLAMYLSDTKAFDGPKREVTMHLLKTGGLRVTLLHRLCLLLRKRGKL